jgi:hypothetical protein
LLASAIQTTEDDERISRGMVVQAVSRLNRGDLTALDAFWDETADDVGVPIKGRGFELVQKKNGQWKLIATREMVVFGGQ